jgi:hypothetical protein
MKELKIVLMIIAELTACPKDELERFPERMRDWLFRVMTDMVRIRVTILHQCSNL